MCICSALPPSAPCVTAEPVCKFQGDLHEFPTVLWRQAGGQAGRQAWCNHIVPLMTGGLHMSEAGVSVVCSRFPSYITYICVQYRIKWMKSKPDRFVCLYCLCQISAEGRNHSRRSVLLFHLKQTVQWLSTSGWEATVSWFLSLSISCLWCPWFSCCPVFPPSFSLSVAFKQSFLFLDPPLPPSSVHRWMAPVNCPISSRFSLQGDQK